MKEEKDSRRILQQPHNLSDFALFLSVMKNKEAYQCTLSIILDEKDLELTEVKVEEVILNESGMRAIRLDAWAMDKKNRRINTEMQNDAEKDDVRKRARFYQGLMDAPVLKSGKGTRYKELPSTIIIFITQEDIFGKDRAKYTFVEQCEEEPGLCLEDGTKKIFLNMSSKNGSPELVSLLQYMKETRMDNPEITVQDERIEKLDEIVCEVKQSEEWEAVQMSIYKTAWEQGMEEGRKAGMAQGIERGMAQGIERGMAQGIERGMAQGIERGMAQGIEQGIEQGLEQGIEQGLEQGLEQGIRAMVEVCCEFELPRWEIKRKMLDKFGICETIAEQYMKEYYDDKGNV